MKMKFCVSVVVKSGEAFLLVKDKEGKFNVPSGHIEPEDQSVVEAAQRELQEESGLEVDIEEIHLVGNTTLTFGETRYHTIVFFTEVGKHVSAAGDKVIDDEDIVSSHWMTAREIDAVRGDWKNDLVMLKISQAFLTITGDPCFQYPTF